MTPGVIAIIIIISLLVLGGAGAGIYFGVIQKVSTEIIDAVDAPLTIGETPLTTEEPPIEEPLPQSPPPIPEITPTNETPTTAVEEIGPIGPTAEEEREGELESMITKDRKSNSVLIHRWYPTTMDACYQSCVDRPDCKAMSLAKTPLGMPPAPAGKYYCDLFNGTSNITSPGWSFLGGFN
jgi:hypothetical protein